MSMAAGGGASEGLFFYPKGRDPQFPDSPTNAELMEMVLALTAEVSVLRDRLDTHEQLASSGQSIDADAVEAFQADEDVADARSAQRTKLLSKVLRPLKVNAAKAAEAQKSQAHSEET